MHTGTSLDNTYSLILRTLADLHTLRRLYRLRLYPCDISASQLTKSPSS